MMRERAWRATGRRTVAGTRISQWFSRVWCFTRRVRERLRRIGTTWHEKNGNGTPKMLLKA